MQPLHVLHLLLIAIWFGVVLAEGVIEFAGTGAEKLAETAAMHYWIDLLLEVPLLVGILVTGALLLAQQRSVTPLLELKVASALIAVGINLVCVGFVLIRYQRRSDPADLLRLSRLIRLSGLGVPFGLLAAAIGFSRL